MCSIPVRLSLSQLPFLDLCSCRLGCRHTHTDLHLFHLPCALKHISVTVSELRLDLTPENDVMSKQMVLCCDDVPADRHP